MRVFVYRNIRRGDWSVKALEGPNKGKVIAHAQRLGLHYVSFKVSEAGRQRVIATGHKNVHAGAEGDLIGVDGPTNTYGLPPLYVDPRGLQAFRDGHLTNVAYHPKDGPDFMAWDRKRGTQSRPIRVAKSAYFGAAGLVLAEEWGTEKDRMERGKHAKGN